MRVLLVVLLALAACKHSTTKPAPPVDPALVPPTISNIERDVRFLADDELKGRNNGTREGARAAEYVAAQMKKAGLLPAGENGTFFQDVKQKGEFPTRNVLGLLKGESDEMVVLGAHHDHLGLNNGLICNGADDNASGVALILEVARRLTAGPVPKRGVLFCSFDAEEDGLVGSRFFVNSNLYPPDRFVAMFCFDLVGGKFLPGEESRLYALGSESSPDLFKLIDRAVEPGLEIARAGIYVIEPMGPLLARSDYSSFRAKKIPFIFFSTGTPWYYHTPLDDVGNLDFPKMERIADLITGLTKEVATGDGRPSIEKQEPNLLRDSEVIFRTCGRLLNDKNIRLTEQQTGQLKKALPRLKQIIEADAKPPEGVRETLQKTMILIFTVASNQGPVKR